MSLPLLALVGLAALAGPLLAGVARWRMPVVIGQLLAGILIGGSGLRLVDATDPTFTFLGEVGFAVTMFVAGTHVPVRDARLRPALLTGVLRAVAVGVLSAAAGFGVAAVFHTGHGALYAVLMASSSAALVLPAVDQLGLGGSQLLPTLAQVAVADTACIVALPLVIDPANAPRAALGALLIAVLSVGIAVGLRWADERDHWDRLRDTSKGHHLALELRISLVVLFGLGAVAALMHVSVLLAGFATGLAVSYAGEPHRLARQLFGVAEGFLAPLYFVWLGASLSIASLIKDPRLVLLGLARALAAAADSIKRTQDHARAASDWTMKTGRGFRLGVSPMRIHLGLFDVPVPVKVVSLRDFDPLLRTRRLMLDEVYEQRDRALRDSIVTESVAAIRARSRERARSPQ